MICRWESRVWRPRLVGKLFASRARGRGEGMLYLGSQRKEWGKKGKKGCICSLTVLKRPICQKEWKKIIFLFKRTMMETPTKKEKRIWICVILARGFCTRRQFVFRHHHFLGSPCRSWLAGLFPFFLSVCKLLMEWHFRIWYQACTVSETILQRN